MCCMPLVIDRHSSHIAQYYFQCNSSNHCNTGGIFVYTSGDICCVLNNHVDIAAEVIVVFHWMLYYLRKKLSHENHNAK